MKTQRPNFFVFPNSSSTPERNAEKKLSLLIDPLRDNSDEDEEDSILPLPSDLSP